MVNIKPARQNDKGQALILIIIVLFIVFFLVVSVSENISVDTINTAQNQKFQKAFSAASTGIDQAKNCLADLLKGVSICNASGGTNTCSYNGNTYQCTYVINPLTTVEETVSNDQALQAKTAGATSATVTFNNQHAILVLNLVMNNGTSASGPDGTATNIMCVYYPSTLTGDGTTTGNVNLTALRQSSALCGGGPSLNLVGGKYSVSLGLAGNVAYVRAAVMDYHYGESTAITIDPIGGFLPTQEYQIIAVGYYGGSRRILTSYYNIFGTPPGIFDYALYNGGNGAKLN